MNSPVSPSISHVAWGSIELLHNLVLTLQHLNALGQAFPVVDYRAKVKLHGTNCAVQVTSAGVFAQSRTTLLSPTSDYKGFAAWALANRDYFAALPTGVVVFGEWCGPGVEKGMAISQVKTKVFAVFAVRLGDGTMVHEPERLRELLAHAAAPEQLYVLPWEGAPVTIPFADRERMAAVVSDLNARVVAVEGEDPWVKRTFGITGLGEGLVFYPTSIDGAPPAGEHQAQLMFKAKGEKHRTAGTREAVQVDPTVVASIGDFVALLVTDARLRQGLSEACNGSRDPQGTRKFIEWVVADVRKESVAELTASGLSWMEVEKAVQARARAWFRAPES